MKIRLVRQVDVKVDNDTKKRQITASRWWAMVPLSSTIEQHSLFAAKAAVDYDKSTPEERCYYFGEHSKGSLSVAWECFQKASALETSNG